MQPPTNGSPATPPGAPPHRQRTVHFSGIGGMGMVAGARLAIEAGWEVCGSDGPLYPPASHMVEALKVPVAVGYDPANLDWRPDLVVIGNALSRGNPEVEAVLERKLRYVSLPEWLKEHVLRPRRPVVVCGTHGKTTTTALTAFLLDRAGLEPGFLVGGQPIDFEQSARLGPETAPFVIEGDEYDSAFFDKRAKFLHYLPEIAVVTSIEFDHGDIYADIAEIELAFQRMLRQIPRSGWLVACADQSRAAALREHAFSQFMTYGFSPDADFRGESTGGQAGPPLLVVYKKGRRWGEFTVPLTGRHNHQNALAALAAAGLLGASPDDLARALPEFKGVRRRMEVFIESHGITFVDDFAHHPTAIAGTVRAVRSKWPDQRLHVLCEPRSNTMVTNRFARELAEAFEAANTVWLGPVYRADRVPEDSRLDRNTLVDDLQHRGADAHAADDVREIVDWLLDNARDGDVVLVLSNGAFDGLHDLLRDAFPA